MAVCTSPLLLLLPLTIWVVGAQMTSCPTNSYCSCEQYRDRLGEVAVDCSNKGLTHIPADLPDNTCLLNMGNNLLTSLEGLPPTLEELYLENNRIEEIKPASMVTIGAIRKVKLNGNRLRLISPETFTQFTWNCSTQNSYFNTNKPVTGGQWTILNLEEVEWPCVLDLRGNPITRIMSNAFRFAKNVTIYLGHSNVNMTIERSAFKVPPATYVVTVPEWDWLKLHISNIPRLTLSAGSFDSMGHIGWIIIDRTELKLRDRLFSPRTNPSWLRISNCDILHLGSNALVMTMRVRMDCRAHIFDYRNNETYGFTTSTIEKGCIELVNNTLPVLPTGMILDSRIGGIYLLGNKIAGFEPGVFQRAGDQNDMCMMRLEGNDFDTIPSHAFAKIRNVIHVQVSTSSLRTIEPDAFANGENIGSLSISFSDNEDIDQIIIRAKAFRNIQQLNFFTISRMESRESTEARKPQLVIAPAAFANLYSVKYMTLNLHKHMPVLPNNLFIRLIVQKLLVLRTENLTRVHQRAFGGPGQSAIQRLEVEGIQSIPCDCETARLFANMEENIETV